jgi:hypothetical protein
MIELSISVKTIMFFISVFTFLLVFNILLRDKIEKYTQYNGVDISYYDWKFITLYMLIGFSFLIFKNKVKEYRKYVWVKDMIGRMEYQKLVGYTLYDDTKYLAYKRYLQLKKLQKISK